MAGQRRIDNITAEGYLADLELRSTDEIRRMRDECEEEESGISYARRVLQGKLDIVRAEAIRRRDAGSATAASVLDGLPGILGGDETGAGVPATRVTRFLVPPAVQHHRRGVDQLADDAILAKLRDRSDEDLAALAERMATKERELSSLRRLLLDRVDALQAELTRRYKTGAASVSELLTRQS
ncbi:MAG: aerial mycelium formation protein [Actinobacteria bacterium]|nr:aerial mycelium formation protein [Actinomycetota bacterium]